VEKGFKESDNIFDDTFTTQVRHPSVAHIKTGVKRDGTILAREVKIYCATGAVFEISGKVEKSLITSIRNRLHRHEMH
jgi:CO/xanthine dehydrogenase Mo-binding subunit